MAIKKAKPKPKPMGNRMLFSVVIPTDDFEILDREAGDSMSWRQLSQKILREFAAEVRNREALAEAEAISA